MSNQVQCPNCGGYKVIIEKQKSIMIQVEKPIRSWIIRVIFTIIISWSIGFIIFIASSGNIYAAFLGDIFIFVPVIAIFRVLKRGVVDGKVKLDEKIGTKYNFCCKLCGYSWVWETGQPLPPVTVRPDLITQGDLKLDNERRKKQEDLAALYYLTHQGKK